MGSVGRLTALRNHPTSDRFLPEHSTLAPQYFQQSFSLGRSMVLAETSQLVLGKWQAKSAESGRGFPGHAKPNLSPWLESKPTYAVGGGTQLALRLHSTTWPRPCARVESKWLSLSQSAPCTFRSARQNMVLGMRKCGQGHVLVSTISRRMFLGFGAAWMGLVAF